MKQPPESPFPDESALDGASESARAGARAGAAAAAILESVPPAMRAIRLRMRKGAPVGLSVPQFRALLYVRRRPGTGLSEIAEHLGTTLPATSELVTRLVRQGLVLRATDERERRRIRLTVSDQGSEQLVAAQRRALGWLTQRLDGYPAERLDALISALGDLAEAVRGDDDNNDDNEEPAPPGAGGG